jgi:hypothetical protein
MDEGSPLAYVSAASCGDAGKIAVATSRGERNHRHAPFFVSITFFWIPGMMSASVLVRLAIFVGLHASVILAVLALV